MLSNKGDMLTIEGGKVTPRFAVPKMINFLLFQLCWFSCVLGAVWGLQFVGVVVAVLVGVVAVLSSGKPRAEFLFLVATMILGTLIDSLQFSIGAFSVEEQLLSPWGYPLWMSAIWVGFASTFGSSLSWLSGRYWLAAVLGFIGGPLAYVSGESLGAIQIGNFPWGFDYWSCLLIIACSWAVVTPGVFLLRSKLFDR